MPRDWIEAPDFETADGDLLDEGDYADERSRMLRSSDEQPRLVEQPGRRSTTDLEWDSDEERRHGGSGKGKGKAPPRDAAGRTLPSSERAPAS